MFNKFLFIKQNTGQVMLMTVLILTLASLATFTISGSLTLSQAKRSRSLTDSTKAIYAADAGIEYELYKAFINSAYPAPTFTNGASFETTLTQVGTSIQSIKSIGRSGNSIRAFQASF